MQSLKNSIANKLSLFALCAKELQWNLLNGLYFLPQKTIQTHFNLSMTATSTMAMANKVCPKYPNYLSMSASWINDLSNSWNFIHMERQIIWGTCFHTIVVVSTTGQLDNQLSSFEHKGELICFNAWRKQCVPQSFCFLDIFPLNIKLHLIGISMDRKAGVIWHPYLSTTTTFYCPQGGRCGEVQLYL